MRCVCGGATKVVDSRLVEGGHIRRRRKCLVCGTRFSTLEQILPDDAKFKKNRKSYEYCFQTTEYSGQDCNKCPFKELCEGGVGND